MPYLTVYTNRKPANTAALAENVSRLVAQTLRKPVQYVVANIIYNENMAFGGSAQNYGALIELKSIGLEDKDKVVAELTSFFAQELNIADTRYINITLTDSPATYTASAGSTFS